jgi:SET and MYND domain-containing protein
MLGARSRRAGSVSAFLLAAPSLSRRRASPSFADARALCSESSPGPSLREMTAGLPVFVGQTETSGRGLYASRAIASGELIHAASPIVAHPTLRNLKTHCYHCLRELRARPRAEWVATHGGGDGGGMAGHFCGRACAQAAWDAYHELETAAGDAFAPLARRCASHEVKFPLAAARLAFAAAQGSASPRAADALVRVNFPPGVAPGDWLEEHAMLRVALLRGVAVAELGAAREEKERGRKNGEKTNGETPARLRFDTNVVKELDAEWYVGVLSRMHLNAFRVEIPPAALPADVAEVPVGDVPDGHGGHGHRGHECGGGGECGHAHHHHHSLPNAGERESAASMTSHSPPARDSFAEAITAAMAASASGVGAGTALYGAPSLLNHSCDPNVDVSWAIDSRASFRAARAIEKDEPLTVAYVDADAGVAARREKLAFAYGFECRCERCVEETSAVQ